MGLPLRGKEERKVRKRKRKKPGGLVLELGG
jgi:hypothetical protein